MSEIKRLCLILAAVASLLLVIGVASGAAPTGRKLHPVAGPVTTLAIDGSRLVYSTDGNGVYVWDVRSDKSWRIRPPSRTDNPLVQQVAIAGQRVAWITRSVSGNSEETFERLYTASSTGAAARKLAGAFRVHEFGQDELQRWRGGWIGGPVGAGNLLAVSGWKTTPSAGGPGLETVSDGTLSVITSGGRLRRIAAGEKTIVVAGADGSRLAVLEPSGSVGIYSATGALLREVTPSSAQQVALGGGRLVVLTKTKTLEVYDPTSGRLEHVWPIATRHSYLQVGHLQAYGRLAVFSVDPRYATRNLEILDLRTGRSLTLPWQWRSAWTDASVGSLGVVYAVNSYKAYGGRHPSGTLVFLSTARVLAMLGGRVAA